MKETGFNPDQKGQIREEQIARLLNILNANRRILRLQGELEAQVPEGAEITAAAILIAEKADGEECGYYSYQDAVAMLGMIHEPEPWEGQSRKKRQKHPKASGRGWKRYSDPNEIRRREGQRDYRIPTRSWK